MRYEYICDYNICDGVKYIMMTLNEYKIKLKNMCTYTSSTYATNSNNSTKAKSSMQNITFNLGNGSR